MRLIDADALIANHFSDNHNIALSYANKLWMRKIINEEDTVDPIHAAGGTYCRECRLSDVLDDKNGYYCNKGITMPLNGFCSEGRKKNKAND